MRVDHPTVTNRLGPKKWDVSLFGVEAIDHGIIPYLLLRMAGAAIFRWRKGASSGAPFRQITMRKAKKKGEGLLPPLSITHLPYGVVTKTTLDQGELPTPFLARTR